MTLKSKGKSNQQDDICHVEQAQHNLLCGVAGLIDLFDLDLRPIRNWRPGRNAAKPPASAKAITTKNANSNRFAIRDVVRPDPGFQATQP